MKLQHKKIIIGVTASIAAYKIVHFVRLLVKEGAFVKVILTPAATQFVSPLALSTVSKEKVLVNISDEGSWNDHVHLGRWADIILIAPLSCNTLAKMANGICDNILLAVYLSATCPVMVAPAMDEDMWKHSSTKENIKRLQAFGNIVLPVGHGSLASGLVGEGRMAEPEEMIAHLAQFFSKQNDLVGKKILITAGPTYEPLDPVRFIGNHSSGKMGVAIAKAAVARGAVVKLVLGPVQIDFDLTGVEVIKVKTAAEMFEAATTIFENVDVAIMSAAVADYTPVNVATQKIKKQDGQLEIKLEKTKDILKAVGWAKTDKQIVVGFALETNNEEEYARKKLVDKNADFIVMNSTKNEGTTFGSDVNKVTIFTKNSNKFEFEIKSKAEVAADILNLIFNSKK